MSLYHSKPPEYFLSIGSDSMNTYDAMNGLKRMIENLEGAAPSDTGTPIAVSQSRVAEGGGASSQTPPSAKTGYTPSGAFEKPSMHDDRGYGRALIALGCVLLVLPTVVALVARFLL